MRSGGNNFNYFSENKLTNLANFEQFIRMLVFDLEDWGEAGLPGPPWLRHCSARFQYINSTQYEYFSLSIKAKQICVKTPFSLQFIRSWTAD